MKTILFCFPGNEVLAKKLSEKPGFAIGGLEIRQFPDGESYVRIISNVKDCRSILICSLDRPDNKLLPLYFTCRALKELGSSRVELVAPYLAYMRQDKRFHPGEAVTSDAFAALLSGFVDRLVTVDPHLHRHHSLAEIYSIPTSLVHAAEPISQWIKNNIQKSLLIGPDEESRQWVEAVAKAAGAPFEVLLKNRKGDRDVDVSIPDVEKYHDHIPVLVDDIISTAHTMIETVKHLNELRMKPPVCIGVHPVFAGDAYAELKAAGTGEIISCNTIIHPSNKIDLTHQLSIVL
ncbi:MAG: ribose-phosphate pyrophosphokinase [Bacteroidetes bacterium]|nr:MAG: ribose-phosphate pyrophosphokinase [Bacteroidota bacterium]